MTIFDQYPDGFFISDAALTAHLTPPKGGGVLVSVSGAEVDPADYVATEIPTVASDGKSIINVHNPRCDPGAETMFTAFDVNGVERVENLELYQNEYGYDGDDTSEALFAWMRTRVLA
jgi:hypothetical protein